MSKLVLTDCAILVNSVDFSDHTSSVEINLSKDDIDTTNFSGGGREHAAGLKNDNFVVNFQQDFATASVDATLFPLHDNDTEFPVVVFPTSSTVASASNPQYSATCILLEYQPLSGAVGALSETSVTFMTQRSGIARSTA